jgi:hypothetical protein
MSLQYQFRPLGAWTEGATKRRRGTSSFSATWQSTLTLLGRELIHLGARNVVLQADFREADLRVDGLPRSNARAPQHPGVRIAFDSKHGPLTYATDAYRFWQHNVRAIALGLEALRAVDRYGVTKRGEQYTGWKQLGAGSGETTGGMTTDAALAVLRTYAPDTKTDEPLERLARWAKAGAHPDRHDGVRTHWDLVEQAVRTLGIAS